MIYIGYYDLYGSKVKRSYATSAVNKIRYLLKPLRHVYGCFVLFSCSQNLETKFKLYPSETKCDGGVKIFFPLSFGGRGKLHKFVSIIWMRVRLFFYLLNNAHKNEHVYVYHATSYGSSILFAKFFKKFKLILEVEEIYSDVKNENRLKKYEYRYFNASDAYVYSTILLNKINRFNKPFVVINGSYDVEKIVSEKYNDKIHVIYAGTFDIRKGGAAAVEAAKYLNENYVIHICGFGSDPDTNYLKKKIDDSNIVNDCKIIFHGLLTGDEYISVLQKCHIGLSPQDPKASFNSTSFPSKILSYLANGLSVVSVRIPAVEQSEVGRLVSYYDIQTPQEIAKAIERANIETDYRNVIYNLSRQFESTIAEFRNTLQRME